MPAATNLGNAKRNLASLETQFGALTTIDELAAVYVQFSKAAADGMASTTTADTLFWTNPFAFPVYVQSGYIVCTGAGITADATNNATITIKTNDGVGGATATALAGTTSLTDLGTITANQPKAFTALTIANNAVPVGGGLWFNIAKGGTGVVVPVSYFMVKLFKAE